MSIKLTIIGLGQIGTSIGLALADQGKKIVRTGSDIDGRIMQQAKKLGAIDTISSKLNPAIRDADIVILATPLDQVQELMETIAPFLKSGSVLMDTAPIKVAPSKWAAALLPEDCSYVGFTPVLNPRYLHDEKFGISAAKADLFQEGLFGIATSPKTKPRAVQLATDLTHLMGADPLFIDLYEIDGLMATTHLLPQFLSAALLNITVDQPGWSEARKVAGRAFAEVTGPAAHLDDLQALVAAAHLNRENIVRKLDDTISALQSIRNDIAEDESAALGQRLKHAKAGVEQWWQERSGGNWLAQELPKSDHIPTSSEIMGGLLGFGIGKKKKRDR